MGIIMVLFIFWIIWDVIKNGRELESVYSNDFSVNNEIVKMKMCWVLKWLVN